jgi:AcrR family transcriptional regulator
MPRPSRHMDQQLLQAGLDILLKKGFWALKVTAICKKAKVNPGMFVYYFKNKENFISHIFQTLKEKLLPAHEVEYLSQLPLMEKLEEALYVFSCFTNQYPMLEYQMSYDFIEEDTSLVEMLKEKLRVKIDYLVRLVKEAQEKALLINTISAECIVLMITTAIDAPILYSKTPEHLNLFSQDIFDKQKKDAVSDSQMRLRIKHILKGFQI